MIHAQHLCANIGANQVLRDISLDLSSGEMFSVICANVAGQTSLLRALSGLLQLEAGTISFDGQRTEKTPAHQLARNGLIHVPQGRQIIPGLSVRDNLTIGAINIGLSQSVIAERMQEQWQRFPVLEKRQKISGSSLSGGEQQRIAVARALINSPSLIFADEPTGNLDSANATALHELFIQCRDTFNQSFLIVTHNESLAQMSNRTLHMKDGKII